MKLFFLLASVLAVLSIVFSAEVSLDSLLTAKAFAKPRLPGQGTEEFLALAGAGAKLDEERTSLWQAITELCSSQGHSEISCHAATFRQLMGAQQFYSNCNRESLPRGSEGDSPQVRYQACVYSYFKAQADQARAQLNSESFQCVCPSQ